MKAIENKTIIFGVSGSISAYKSPMIIRELIKLGANVKVVMTQDATNFVSPLVLSNLTKNKVIVNQFDENINNSGAWHVELANHCDLMIVAPASMNTIAKLANGLCDNSLMTTLFSIPFGYNNSNNSTSLNSKNIPIILSPAMDYDMWYHPVNQRNINILKEIGYIIIEPEEGELSSGLIGKGRLPDTNVIVNEVLKYIVGSTQNNNNIDNSNDNINNEAEIIESNIISNITDNSNITNNIVEENINSPEVIVAKEVNKFDNIKQRIIELEKKLKIEALISKKVDNDTNINTNSIKDDIAFNVELDLELLKKKNLTEFVISEHQRKLSLLSKYYLNKKILITAGPTYEKIDDVRFISNFSTGKMGYCLAKVAIEMGAEVTLISGPVNDKLNDELDEKIKLIKITSAKEMLDKVLGNYQNQDILIFSAAVSDYSPKYQHIGKLKKDNIKLDNLELIENKDILKTIGNLKSNTQLVVGFALESENLEQNATTKLNYKNADIIIGNYANKEDSGFGGDNNTITIISKNQSPKPYPKTTKNIVALNIFEFIEKY